MSSIDRSSRRSCSTPRPPTRSSGREPSSPTAPGLRRARRRIDAREQLRAALDTFESLGAIPWAGQASAELAATGETARRRDVSTLDQLTARELQVALLLSGGLTTRVAAGQLFLSPKTVEYHLRHVYQKLGIRSRTELAATFQGASRVIDRS
jgi:DNA-binding CsgD family transcriptional regulator